MVALQAAAQNPYLPLGEFIPDGEPYVFDDPDCPGKKRVYVYGSHDNLVTEYCGKDQVVWSADVNDLTHWRYDGIIFESKVDAKGRKLHKDGTGDVLYAPDVTCRKENGKTVYYLYPNNQAGGRNGQIAKAERPDGPFKVCNWKTASQPSAKGQEANGAECDGVLGFDPAVFIDDDGKVYGYWGFKRSNGAELDPVTMATVKEGTKVVEDMIPGYEQDKTYRFFEASSIRKIKDKYVFIYSRWTNPGEFGLWESNYTLAYCYSNNPLGPWTYGGTIIDGRAREKKADGTTISTACPNGNTHGSICEINGKWWVFYHRQAGTNEYCRQAMVAPIDVEVMEGKDGYVRISEAEVTSEGFATDGLDPYTRYAAGIACYYVGPQPAHAEYPNVVYPGSHTKITRVNYEGVKSPYDAPADICPMVNNVDGSAIGYKYFNFSKTYGKKQTSLVLNIVPEGVAGTIDVYLDRPCTEEGGVKVGSVSVKADGAGKAQDVVADVSELQHFNGKHALFLVFSSETKGKSICQLNTLEFSGSLIQR